MNVKPELIMAIWENTCFFWTEDFELLGLCKLGSWNQDPSVKAMPSSNCTCGERIKRNKNSALQKKRRQGILPLSLSDCVREQKSEARISNQSSLVPVRSLNLLFFGVWKTHSQEVLFNIITKTSGRQEGPMHFLFWRKAGSNKTVRVLTNYAHSHNSS